MSSRIRVLDDNAINQIAAGEVIESAASCVKELIENAIDASATFIRIETKAAGRALIRVEDNGTGMSGDDLLLSIERHATSKITTTQDLQTLKTLGFRGEALASIASVSKMAFHTALEGERGGMTMGVEGGKIVSFQPAPRTKGTSVEVKRLFYNIPVRKHFQKSESHDQGQIHKILIGAALAHPHVGFEWISDDKIEFSLPPVSFDTSYLKRIETLLGTSFATSLLPCTLEETPCHLFGYLSLPAAHKPNRHYQTLFINGRPVVSPFLSAVVSEGYGTRIPTDRYPGFLLHLFLPTEWIDANVHPQKIVVRLREEATIRQFLLRAIEKTLHIPTPPLTYVEPPKSPLVHSPISLPIPPPSYTTPSLIQKKREILALFEGYIFMEGLMLPHVAPHTLVVFDEMAAKRRIFYDSFQNATLAHQQLLLPLILSLSPLQEAQAEELSPYLVPLGIELRSLGRGTYAIDSLPLPFEADQIESLIYQLLEVPTEKLVREEIQKRVAFSLCREIRKTCKTMEEASLVVEKLLLCKENTQCPLGKPTMALLMEKDIAKWF